MTGSSHCTDEQLVLAADGELHGCRAAQVRAHLAACWECRARMAEIDATVVDFMQAHRRSLDPQLPPIAGPRALLRARLAELSSSRPPVSSERWTFHLASARTIAILLCVALLILAAFSRNLVRRSRDEAGNSIAFPIDQRMVPDPKLTPGATRNVDFAEVCSMFHEEVVAEVSPSLEQEVFREYGIVNARPSDYEIDYLIAPGLGGTQDIRNLWPQPYLAGTWNARVKDSLEEHLHQLVCARQLDLATAQRDISANWIAAYKKYLHTDKPLSVAALHPRRASRRSQI